MALPAVRRRELKGRPRRPRLVIWVVPVIAAVALIALGCGNLRTGEAEIYGIAKFNMIAFPETGANVIEMFNEMHYQPSYKSQEGPRLLPPPDSVPVSGRELRYAKLEDYRDLTVPAGVAESYDGAAAAELFRVNCMVCHGVTLKGDGPIRPFMTKGPFPADLTSDITQGSTDGELFAFISRGGRQGLAATERGRESQSPMPEFLLLLTEQERWALAMYLRSR